MNVLRKQMWDSFTAQNRDQRKNRVNKFISYSNYL